MKYSAKTAPEELHILRDAPPVSKDVKPSKPSETVINVIEPDIMHHSKRNMDTKVIIIIIIINH